MKNPALLLRDYFSPPKTQLIGVVVEVALNTIRVRVATGIIECQPVTGAVYFVNDNVLVRGGLIVSKVLPASAVPVYKI